MTESEGWQRTCFQRRNCHKTVLFYHHLHRKIVFILKRYQDGCIGKWSIQNVSPMTEVEWHYYHQKRKGCMFILLKIAYFWRFGIRHTPTIVRTVFAFCASGFHHNFNLLATGRYGCSVKSLILNLISNTDIVSISCVITFRWISRDFAYD